MLDQIDQFLSNGTDDSRELWTVLTALRGPDDENDTLKDKSTAIIRGAAFPLCLAQSEHPTAYGFAHGALYREGVTITVPETTSHFTSHAEDAAITLNLGVSRDPA